MKLLYLLKFFYRQKNLNFYIVLLQLKIFLQSFDIPMVIQQESIRMPPLNRTPDLPFGCGGEDTFPQRKEEKWVPNLAITRRGVVWGMNLLLPLPCRLPIW